MQKYQSPALDKGLDILEYLSLHEKPQSQTEIAYGTEKKPNQIYRMLVCLEGRGYINKDVVSGKFSLSLKLYHLSHRHSPINSIRKAALYPMQELSEFSGQSCHLSILNGFKVLIISQSLSPGHISLSVEDGGLFPLDNTTSGRIILSQLQKEERLMLLNKGEYFPKMSKQKQKLFLKEIEEIAEIGHAIRTSETTQGVYDVAVPVGIPDINITGSLIVSILSGQSQKSVTDAKLIAKTKATTIEIYKNLGLEIR